MLKRKINLGRGSRRGRKNVRLNRMFREGLAEGVTLKGRLEGGEGGNCSRGKGVPGRRINQCKSPVVEDVSEK